MWFATGISCYHFRRVSCSEGYGLQMSGTGEGTEFQTSGTVHQLFSVVPKGLYSCGTSGIFSRETGAVLIASSLQQAVGGICYKFVHFDIGFCSFTRDSVRVVS